MGYGQEAVLLPLDLWGDIHAAEGSLRPKWEEGEGLETAAAPGDDGDSSERRAGQDSELSKYTEAECLCAFSHAVPLLQDPA